MTTLEALVDLPAEAFHLADATDRGIPAWVFQDRDVRGTAVLLHTGWDRHFGTPAYGNGAPFLTENAAHYLSELPPSGARFTGVPPKIAAFGTFPVRAFASVPGPG